MGNAALVAPKDEQDIATKTGLPVEQVSNGVVLFGGKPYINIVGKRYKMDERFGPGQWGVEVNAVPSDERVSIMEMWGKKPPMIIMKARILLNGNPIAEDYGWSSPDSAPAGRSQFEKDGLGLASSKAQSRAMAQLVANGFASEERAGERSVMGVETGSAEAGFLKETRRLKKEIGDENYYAVLHNHDLQHANDGALRGKPQEMAKIVEEMNGLDAASAAILESLADDAVVEELMTVEVRAELLAKIIDPDVPVDARENAVMDLMCDLEKVQKLREECPLDSDKSYAEIMAGFVSNAMQKQDFVKTHGTLTRAMELIAER